MVFTASKQGIAGFLIARTVKKAVKLAQLKISLVSTDRMGIEWDVLEDSAGWTDMRLQCTVTMLAIKKDIAKALF